MESLTQTQYEWKIKFLGHACENCLKSTQSTHKLDGSYLCSPCYRACVG
jgi:hypothetical protein